MRAHVRGVPGNWYLGGRWSLALALLLASACARSPAPPTSTAAPTIAPTAPLPIEAEVTPATPAPLTGTAIGHIIAGYNDSSPVAGLPLWLGRESVGPPVALTDANGTFTITNVPVGQPVDVVDDHLSFQFLIGSSATTDVGTFAYPLVHPAAASPTAAVSMSPTAASITPVMWDVYDPNPNHLWNRLFHALYGRTGADGQEYGRDELDPLLWQETNTLITGPSHQRVLAVLDEFLSTHGESLITDPVRRAMLQRDVWAVFDWLTFSASDDTGARSELEQRLAQVIQRLALSRRQIEALPNNYDAALLSGVFPATYQAADPQATFLPSGMFTAGSDWIGLGRQGGPMAMTHLQTLPFLGRSALLVFLRVPGRRPAGLAYVQALPRKPHPNPPAGTNVALVRRMLLIDDQGEIVPAPLIESIQLRQFDQDTTQHYFELVLDRGRLFADETGGLRAVTPRDRDFLLFESPGDVLTLTDIPDEVRPPMLSTCQGCHFDGLQGISGADSILSFSRARFPLPDRQLPVLAITTPDQETQTTMAWKMVQTSWQQLLALWSKP